MKYKTRVCDWAMKKEGGAESFREKTGDRQTDRQTGQRRWRKRMNQSHSEPFWSWAPGGLEILWIS